MVETLRIPVPGTTLKWCRFCGRRHLPGMRCGFIPVEREAASGEMATRMVLPRCVRKFRRR